MAHTIKVNGAKVVRVIVKNKTRYHVVVDPQNSQVEFVIPYDQRMYRGLHVNFEGQIVEASYKFVRVQPSSVTFYMETNL